MTDHIGDANEMIPASDAARRRGCTCEPAYDTSGAMIHAITGQRSIRIDRQCPIHGGMYEETQDEQ